MKYIIVGYGNIGHKRNNVLNGRCVATIDPDPIQKADFPLSQNIPVKLLDKFNAVILAVPKQPKYELLKYWLEKGKHVLVEKPLILDRRMANTLSKIAKRNKVVWYTGYNHHFEPNIVRVERLLKANAIGRLYHAKMEYSFGNIKQLLGTWRETGYGVLDETGCHLIDFTRTFFGYQGHDFKAISLRRVESNTFDHCLYTTQDDRVLLETGWTTWKNVFSIEIYGSKGSLHMNGLCKWGSSKLIIRKRVFPAGVPVEKEIIENQPDSTWIKDIKYFEKMVGAKKTSCDSDVENTTALVSIVLSSCPKDKILVTRKLQGLI